MPLPHYYTSLSQFREVFLTGRPVLTYHHVGNRPRGTRIKGLYVSPKLFGRQMAELDAAGFSTAAYQSVTSPGEMQKTQVFLTFDDGFRDVFENALPIMRRHEFCAIQFLVSSLLGKTNEWQEREGEVSEPLMDEAQVRDWLAAGHEIGSHTLSHPHLTRLAAPAAREEIRASKHQLEDRFGRAIKHFCYPYGDWNESVRDLVQEAGYETACTTESGINSGTGDRFALKRFTARYRSRNWKSLMSWLRWRFFG
jgi:peptidoglycan/xylan/chitin deacetylase (PgdA/CDA1 family)